MSFVLQGGLGGKPPSEIDVISISCRGQQPAIIASQSTRRVGDAIQIIPPPPAESQPSTLCGDRRQRSDDVDWGGPVL